MNRIKIGNKLIGERESVFIIAEAGVNHNGSIELARKLVDLAVKAGADAVKFQSFKTESMMTKSAPSAEYHLRATGNTETWFELLKRLELKEQDHYELLAYCKKKGVIFLSTPYDETSAEFLNSLDIPAFKIASTDLNNIPLLERIASYGKPILLSTGMSKMEEIKESVECIVGKKNKQIVLFQCTSNYPPKLEDANLNVIDTLRKEFNLLVGYSDHLACSQVAIAAVAKGICVYEVHYTLDRKMPGPDQKSSLDPQELRQIINDIRFTEKLLGSYNKEVTASEKETRLKLRKSIVAINNIKTGDKITRDKIGIKRLGTGLPPKYFFALLGRTAKRNIAKDEPLQLQDLAEE